MGKLKRVIELFQMVWSQLEAEAIKFIFDFRFYGFSSERQKAHWEMGDETENTHSLAPKPITHILWILKNICLD